ncbi:WD repeat-containing protein 76 isoform X2 [Pyxicephalus adspersus]|uniref:WD repeat-containing protein 76 isoform X2 n=1 Tax=Pyxicephalus adspersus TaxID=30357 RepID=UPI003B5B1F6D
MSGCRAQHSKDMKLPVMESTPNMVKTTNGGPASLEHDVLTTPSKRDYRKKRLLEENHHLEGGAGKRTCMSLEGSCVRRPLIHLLSNLKAEPENLQTSRENSDQEAATEKKSDLPAKMSKNNKCLVVRLERLAEESGNLKEKFDHENDINQNNESNIRATRSTSAPRTRSVSGRNLRNKIQADTVEEEEAESAANSIANLNLNPEVVEEKQSIDESDSEEESDQDHMGLSAYERARLKNIKENAKFLNSIKLLESAASLLPPKKKNPNRVVKREKPQNTHSTVVRRSMRLQNLTPSEAKQKEQAPTVEENVQVMKPPGPIEMIPVNQQNDNKAMEQFLNMWSSISQETVKTTSNTHVKALKSYENSLNKMKLRQEDVAKVVPGRISSVAIHPSRSRTLVASGDKYGNVGLWNLEDNSADMGIYTFELHSRYVGCLSFCPWNSAQLLSLSYDGTVRCGDVTRTVFDEIYRDEEENFSSFDFFSSDGSVLIVSHWDSQLSLVDRRTPGTTYEGRAPVDLSGPRTVSVHPLQRELCVVAGAGDVCVYDVRQLSQKKLRPVLSLPGHTKSVQSAYFSPVSGNRILTTCADDRLRVFDSSSLSSTVPLLTSIRHNNFTGRWLSRFRAVWDPKQEDCFVIGSMERPRQIQVFHENGNLVHNFWDAENLNSVCSINAMHPTRSILVGGNSSGRLHVFRD